MKKTTHTTRKVPKRAGGKRVRFAMKKPVEYQVKGVGWRGESGGLLINETGELSLVTEDGERREVSLAEAHRWLAETAMQDLDTSNHPEGLALFHAATAKALGLTTTGKITIPLTEQETHLARACAAHYNDGNLQLWATTHLRSDLKCDIDGLLNPPASDR